MKKRYISLDVLRGLTIFFMCVVNNPGSWTYVFPPLRHTPWTGCTPTDLVFPFFVFCMGCAMAFSFSKYDGLSKDAVWKIFKRGIGIFLVGLLLNAFPFFPVSVHDESWTFGQNYLYWLQHVRIFGVLQRTALCYVIAALIVLGLKKKPGKILAAIAALCILYTGILVAFGTDPGPFTLEGTVSRKIDVACVGQNHVYHHYHYSPEFAAAQEYANTGSLVGNGESIDDRAYFDPEGPLGGLTGACTVLLGFLIGSMILRSMRRDEAHKDLASYDGDSQVPRAKMEKDMPGYVDSRIFVYGCISLALGLILSIWIPISKPLWSASYVFYAGGWAMVCLAFLAYFIDVKGIEKPFEPARAMGMNALMAFILSGVLAKSYVFFDWSPNSVFGANAYLSLLYAVIFALVIFCFQWFFYKKHIVIKL